MGKRLSKITAFLEMPEEIISDKPRITILGFNELVIENYKNILEYDEIFIKVNTYIGAINISGVNLKLIQMNKEDIMVTGKIDSLDFEENE
ncbi:MAG: sporulation protein YqfC [Clostridia bacterium]|jgi:sporulation protein YqfC|nr:sporulation protein YqfC [Clostridia bacterium]